MDNLKFKKYRTARGLSVSELAKLLDVHRTYIYKIEKGETVPSIAFMERAAKVFNKHLKDFF